MELIDFTKLKVSCQKCSLAELCLPHGLSKADLEKLDQFVRHPKPLGRGDYLFRSGDALGSLHAVRSGSAKLVMGNSKGEEQILGFYLPGEVVGFDAINTGRHTCSAMALETSSICSLPYSQLAEISRSVPSLQEQVLRLIGREMSIENELLLTINKKSADERIATFLISISHRFRRLGYAQNEFRLSMSRQEIGNYLGLTIETVSRSFTRLQKRRLISTQRRSVKLLDVSELHEMSHGAGGAAPQAASRAEEKTS
ncbi:MAG: transcriptional regulator [Gammaproteobacteria bacterium RIFCSPLOWO2_02_FULL_61_13]|nr:MAG: transcriptional regulator [Gammaproteobacteria bacterium RIFCSPLOWO2_02_FULL_61_13]